MEASSTREVDIRHVLDALGEALLAVDRSTRILHANGALKELLGWSRMELLGQPFVTVVPGGLPEQALEPVVSESVAGESGQPSACSQALRGWRTQARRRDGALREVEVAGSVWCGAPGQQLLLLCFRDLEPQVELERQLGLYRRLNLLQSALSQALAPLEDEDEEEAAHATLQVCGETEGWALGVYWRVEGGLLRPLALWMGGPSLQLFIEATLQRTFCRGQGLPGRVWQSGMPLVCEDVQKEMRFLRRHEALREGVRGALFAPVVGSGPLYGVLELFSRSPRQSLPDDEAVASLLGRQLGLYLDRQRRRRTEQPNLVGLRKLWDAELLGLHLSDAQGLIHEANPALLRMLGYTLQDVHEGRLTWASLIPERLRTATEQVLERLLAGGDCVSFESELLRKDGRALPVLVGSVGVNREHVASFVLDLTDWRQSEPSAPRSAPQEQLSRLVSCAPMSLFALDRQGVFTLSEGGALQEMGLRPGQVVGSSLFDLYRTMPAILAAARRALAGEEFSEVNDLGSAGVWEIRWIPQRDGQGGPAGCMGVCLNVTEHQREVRLRAQLLAELEKTRVAAEQAVRLRDEFLTVASHELKTPMTALHLQVQLLLRQVHQGGPLETRAALVGRLEKAQHQVQRLVRLVEDLLDVSRVTAGRLQLELEQVDLVAVVCEVLERFQDEAARCGGRLELRGERSAVGRWDPARLDQVVTNLVSNALKYGPGAPVEVTVSCSGAMALLEVRDHGIGIAPEHLERVFGKFERAVSVRQYGGLGLGLFIVRQLVEALGGVVEVESRQGDGALFRVVLPLAGPSSLPSPQARAEMH